MVALIAIITKWIKYKPESLSLIHCHWLNLTLTILSPTLKSKEQC